MDDHFYKTLNSHLNYIKNTLPARFNRMCASEKTRDAYFYALSKFSEEINEWLLEEMRRAWEFKFPGSDTRRLSEYREFMEQKGDK